MSEAEQAHFASELDLRSIEDRIIEMVGDEPLFTMDTIRDKFPHETDRAVYRALNKLEETNRIKFIHWRNRKKVYTTHGVSKVPNLPTLDGKQAPLREAMKWIDSFFENGRWKTLDEINTVLPDIMLMFQIAHIDDRKEMKTNYSEIQSRLSKHRSVLTNIVSWIDIIQKHPLMAGDLDYFKATLTDNSDPGVPSVEEIIEFKRWYTKFKAAQKNEG